MILFALILLLVGATGWVLTRLHTRAAEARFGPTGQAVGVAGGAVRYLEAGAPDGHPIVLLHGAFGGAEDWSATVLGPVGERGRALAFDRPGHGWSSGDARRRGTPRLQALILSEAARELELERPVLVGFSYGAAVALAWALERPDEVGGLLLLAPVSHPWPGGPDLSYRVVGVPLLGELLAATWLTPIARTIRQGGARSAFDPETPPPAFDHAPIPLALSEPRLLANSEDLRLLSGALARQAPRYGDLDLPVTIVQGTGDRTLSPDIHARALARAVPGARLVELEGAGHQLPYARPQELLSALDELLERIDARAKAR